MHTATDHVIRGRLVFILLKYSTKKGKLWVCLIILLFFVFLNKKITILFLKIRLVNLFHFLFLFFKLETYFQKWKKLKIIVFNFFLNKISNLKNFFVCFLNFTLSPYFIFTFFFNLFTPFLSVTNYHFVLFYF